MDRLAHKVAIVTGGASGIGAAVAQAFVAEGCRVVIADIDAPGAELTARRLGPTARSVVLDVTESSQWKSAVASTVDAFGGVDILVNNAGTGDGHNRIDHETEASHDRLVRLNITGVWNGIRAAIPAMKARGGGSIVNTSSINGLVGCAGMSTYAATKFAVTGLTRSAALELGDIGIRVNAVHPGSIETPLVAALDETARAAIVANLQRQGIKRLGRPEEVAQAFVFFASDESSYCTAASLVVDGGTIAGRYFDLPGD